MVSTSHNSFLSLAAELGLAGLALYAAVLGALARPAWRQARQGVTAQGRWRGIALLSGLVAYLVPAFFANTIYIDTPLHHVYLYVYAGAVAALYTRQRAPALARSPHRRVAA
jgi:O-antigen ligase